MNALIGAADGRPRWEHRVLQMLEYPANLVLANLAGVLLVLPLVTWFPAAVAVTGSLRGWLREEDRRPFLGTFAALRRTWRRDVPLGLALTVAAVVSVTGMAFLAHRPGTPAAVLLGMHATCAALGWVFLVALVPCAARMPQLSCGALLRQAAADLLRAPLRPALTAGIVAVLLPAALLSPPVFLCCGLSLPALLALGASPHEPRENP